MRINDYFLLCIITGLLKGQEVVAPECKYNTTLSGELSETIAAGPDYKKHDECIWTIFPMKDMQLIINVTHTSCTKDYFKLVPPGDDLCKKGTPFTLKYFPESCLIQCKGENNCYKLKNEVEVKYKGNPNGFLLNYQFIPCQPETTTTLPTVTTIPTTATIKISTLELTTQLIEDTTEPTIATTPEHTTTSDLDVTTNHFKQTTTNKPPDAGGSDNILIAVFVPITIILLLMVVALLVFLKIRKKNLMFDESTPTTPDPTNNDNKDSVERNAFGNMAYDTVLEFNQDQSYASINNGQVYYSSVAADVSQNSGQRPSQANIYNEVNLEENPNHNQPTNTYEDVHLNTPYASQGSVEENADSNEKVEVCNVLYGETQ